MPRFLYQARDGRGEALTGTVQAMSLEDAGKMLRGEGKFIVKLAAAPDDAPAASVAPIGSRHGKVKRGEVIYFAHQIAVMMQTGVPLSEALQCCVDQAQNPAFKAVLDDVAKSVQAGGEFSAALRKYPRCSPP
jgi:type IV pilus assembly protein PilC